MKTITQLLLVPVIASTMLLTACGEKNKPAENTEKTQTSASTSAAPAVTTPTETNVQPKAENLSSANAQDIKSDLASLNTIINNANSKAAELRDELKASAQNKDQIQQVLTKTQAIQEQLKQEILSLQLKSSEVQKIRVQMIDNLATATQLYQMSHEPNFNLASPSDEFKKLSERSIIQQQQIGNDLNALSQKYPQ